METITVAVCTFGDLRTWDPLAQQALRSAAEQSCHPDELLRIHGETLAKARNSAIQACQTDWLLFLDADDLLDPFYIEQMAHATGDLRYPQVRYVKNGVTGPIERLQEKPLLTGNYIVIGAMMRAKHFRELGGFHELPAWEDWSLWLRAWIAGLSIEPSEAIYVARVREGSRNQISSDEAMALYTRIRNEYEPLAKAKGLV